MYHLWLAMKTSQFYTGLVADMYDDFVSYRAPVALYENLIRNGGEPALELGCGTGHPLLDLVYRTIFLAGASFMLLSDAGDAERTLQRIFHHLEPGGRAIIPLYIPPLSPDAENATDQWRIRERVRPSDGATLRVGERFHFDSPRQMRVSTLRCEVIRDGAIVQEVERPWLLRWYSQPQFRRLLHEAGFGSPRVLGEDGNPAHDDAPAFVFIALRPPVSV